VNLLWWQVLTLQGLSLTSNSIFLKLFSSLTEQMSHDHVLTHHHEYNVNTARHMIVRVEKLSKVLCCGSFLPDARLWIIINCTMQRQESLYGSWPIVSCPRDYEFLPGKCKLMILEGCRHHIAGLRCRLPEESLCSLPTHSSLYFPGQFVLSQFVVALGSDKQELFECYMEASRNGNFKIVSNASMVLVGKASSLVHSRDSRNINNVRDQ